MAEGPCQGDDAAVRKTDGATAASPRPSAPRYKSRRRIHRGKTFQSGASLSSRNFTKKAPYEKEEDRDADEKIAFKITINEIVLYEKKGGEKMKRNEEIIALLEDAVSEAEKAMKESRDGRGGCG